MPQKGLSDYLKPSRLFHPDRLNIFAWQVLGNSVRLDCLSRGTSDVWYRISATSRQNRGGVSIVELIGKRVRAAHLPEPNLSYNIVLCHSH